MGVIDPKTMARLNERLRRSRESGQWPLPPTELDALVRDARAGAAPGYSLDVRQLPDGPGLVIRVTRTAPSRGVLASLTPREREVARLAADGLTNAEIAERLGISPATVKDHISNVLARVGVRRRVELARLIRLDDGD